MLMNCFDIHTHRIPPYPDQAIVSVDVMSLPLSGSIAHASIGIHPWHLKEDDADISLKTLQEAIENPRIVAIGEVGLDKLKGPSIDIQTAVFRQAIALSELHELPLIIHCVRAFNELLQLKKKFAPKQPWIVHGFRGKETVARELLRHGCWLSIGAHFQEEALRIIPLQRLFIETDESEESIENICQQVATSRGVAPEELSEAIKKNVRKVFFKA